MAFTEVGLSRLEWVLQGHVTQGSAPGSVKSDVC
jgi:hypothetical protein